MVAYELQNEIRIFLFLVMKPCGTLAIIYSQGYLWSCKNVHLAHRLLESNGGTYLRVDTSIQVDAHS